MRGMSQIKDAIVDGKEARLSWSPQVDLRNCGLDGIVRAIEGVDVAFWEPWFADYLKLSGFHAARLELTCRKLIEGIRAFLADRSRELGACLDESGFLSEPGPCQLAILGRLGQMYLAHYAYAVGGSSVVKVEEHETLGVDPDMPFAPALRKLLDEGDRIARTLAPPIVRPADQVGLGLQLLRPYMVSGIVGGLKGVPGGIFVDTTRVPEVLASRIVDLRWTPDSYVLGTRVHENWKFWF